MRHSVWASYHAFTETQAFADALVPGGEKSHMVHPTTTSVSSTVMVLMTGNIYLLLAGLAVLCCLFSTPQVARNYLLIVACADLGHIYSFYSGLGRDTFLDVARWNDMTWGNVGVSAFLFVNRLATAAGVFGVVPRQGLKRD